MTSCTIAQTNQHSLRLRRLSHNCKRLYWCRSHSAHGRYSLDRLQQGSGKGLPISSPSHLPATTTKLGGQVLQSSPSHPDKQRHWPSESHVPENTMTNASTLR